MRQGQDTSGKCGQRKFGMNGASQSEIEGYPPIHLPFRPDPAAVTLDDSLHRGKAYAAPLELLPAVETLERAKQQVGLVHVKPGSVVPNEEGTVSPGFDHPELDLGRLPFSGVFPGIANEIFHHYPKQHRVSLDHDT